MLTDILNKHIRIQNRGSILAPPLLYVDFNLAGTVVPGSLVSLVLYVILSLCCLTFTVELKEK